MERECFEDEEVAKELNKYFISIKVDREERPDVDSIYMNVCQALTGSGGWPLSIFMTPDAKPFYSGTYFPKHNRMGLPGFMTLLESVSSSWKKNRDKLIKSAQKIIDSVSDANLTQPTENIDFEVIEGAFNNLIYSFDETHGGFGRAPKFPVPHYLTFLLRYWNISKNEKALMMLEKTLKSMYSGGIYDHVGFGFSRYSTDSRWLVPHFEKMLYDNALLAIAYTEACHATGKTIYGNIAQNIITYILRDMTSPEGAFYSAEDADSEGIEGKFYVWSYGEVIDILGKNDGHRFCRIFNITKQGNFEDKNIPNLIGKDLPLDEDKEFAEICRSKLFKHRENRVHPHKDDKILTSWNGLMIAALAYAGRVFSKEEYIVAAEKAADFINNNLTCKDGRLLARYRDGEAAFKGYADDYANLTWAFTELYLSTYKSEYLERALSLSNDLINLFWDNDSGGLYLYGRDSEKLISRPKELYDGAMPSANSTAAYNFLRLSDIAGRIDLKDRAMELFKVFGGIVNSNPTAYIHMISALLYYKSPATEIIITGELESKTTMDMIKLANTIYNPFASVLLIDEEMARHSDTIPAAEKYKPDDKTTAYVCSNYSCKPPAANLEDFAKRINHM